MNTLRTETRATIFVVVLLASLGALATTFADTAAQVVGRADVVLEFTDLRPGTPVSVEHPIDVPVPAEVADAGIVDVTGIAASIDWTIELCNATACRTLTAASIGTPVAPDDYALRVTANLREAVAGSGSATGHVRLVAAEGELPRTGFSTTMVALVAVGLVALGAVALRARRQEAS